jgi:sec-independent protein translocase protein TatB
VFNVTGSELIIILLIALIVLGPEKLPEAVRKFGRVYGELRRMSQGFQSELRDALDEPMREVRNTVNTVKSGFDDDDAEMRMKGPVDDGPPVPQHGEIRGPGVGDDGGTAPPPAPEPAAPSTADAEPNDGPASSADPS